MGVSTDWLNKMPFSGTGKSSLGNVLLGRGPNFKDEENSDGTKCFTAGGGVDPSTKDTCAQAGRFAISQNAQI